jgi:hypothetical protein
VKDGKDHPRTSTKGKYNPQISLEILLV